MDSLNSGTIPNHVKQQICAIMHTDLDIIRFHIASVQQQTGGVDCGLFAIAFARHVLAHNQLPEGTSFSQSSMRRILRESLTQGDMIPFESTSARVARCKKVVREEPVYCTCRTVWIDELVMPNK